VSLREEDGVFSVFIEFCIALFQHVYHRHCLNNWSVFSLRQKSSEYDVQFSGSTRNKTKITFPEDARDAWRRKPQPNTKEQKEEEEEEKVEKGMSG
jgi:hypothetical protein